MQSLIFFVIALSVLIVIHEYGHFWVARRCGVKVLRFSVGFGEPIWRRLGKDGTEYVLAPIPLGGYVKMLDEREAPVAEAEREFSFNRKSLRARVAIVAAGPIANLLFAVVAYWLLFVSGIPGLKPMIDHVEPASIAAEAGVTAGDQIISVNGQVTPTWRAVMQTLVAEAEQGNAVDLEVASHDAERQLRMQLPQLGLEQAGQVLTEVGLVPMRPSVPAVIGELVAGGVAERSGLQTGDRLIAVNGEALSEWSQWVEKIQASAGELLQVTIMRGDERRVLDLIPERNEQGVGFIGVGPDMSAVQTPDALKAEIRYSPLPAVKEAVGQVWTFSVTTLKSLWGMLVGSVSTDNLGGPISIAQIAGSSAEQGVQSFISFLAMISITLGILNLLPIPVLDGGHLALFLLEWLRGKPLDESVQAQCQRVGMILLLSLMFLAFYNDLTRLFG